MTVLLWLFLNNSFVFAQSFNMDLVVPLENNDPVEEKTEDIEVPAPVPAQRPTTPSAQNPHSVVDRQPPAPLPTLTPKTNTPLTPKPTLTMKPQTAKSETVPEKKQNRFECRKGQFATSKQDIEKLFEETLGFQNLFNRELSEDRNRETGHFAFGLQIKITLHERNGRVLVRINGPASMAAAVQACRDGHEIKVQARSESGSSPLNLTIRAPGTKGLNLANYKPKLTNRIEVEHSMFSGSFYGGSNRASGGAR